MESFEKQPSEAYTIAIDFTAAMPASTTISSGVVSAIDMTDQATVSATVLATTVATIDSANNLAKVKVRAGTNGRSYKVTFVVTLSNTDILEEEVLMVVKNR